MVHVGGMEKTPESVVTNPIFLPDDFQQLRAFATSTAEADAEMVGTWINSVLGPAGTSGAPRLLSGSFLLGLGIAMRMRRWEADGNNPHLEAGLPSASQLQNDLGRLYLAERDAVNNYVAGLYKAINSISTSSFAWAAGHLVGVDVLLGPICESDEDHFVEAFARFAWEHRHDGDQNHED